MTEIVPEPAEDDGYDAAARKVAAEREEYKADLADLLEQLQQVCLAIWRLDGDLNDGESDWADGHPAWKPWLHGGDLDAFRKMLTQITDRAKVLAAINRPHPGTALWPQQIVDYAWPRMQYAIHATTHDGQRLIIGSEEPGRTGLREADFLLHRVLADPSVAAAEVKVRRWIPEDWQTPARDED